MTLAALRLLSRALVTATVSCALWLSTAQTAPGSGQAPRAVAASAQAPARPALQRLAAARDFFLARVALARR